jgi:ketosteroid isomerase-like protein
MRTWSVHGTRRLAAFLTILVGLLGFLCPAVTAIPRGQRHEVRHEIDLMEEQWRTAMLQNNGSVLENLLADDFTGITASGTIQTREQLLSALTSGTVKISSLAISERKVRIYGVTAVVTSVAEITGTQGERELTGRYRYTRVYVHNPQGQWKIVSFEASRILEPAEHK